MSRKRREEKANQERQRQRLRTVMVVACVVLFMMVLVGAGLFKAEESSPKGVPVAVPGRMLETYLALKELPSDDEAAKALIRREYYNFDGFKVYARESDIPLETLLVPDSMFSDEELRLIAKCITVIGGTQGDGDPVFLALKEWAERKPGRIIEELLPLDKKIAIRNDRYQFAFDAFWSPKTKMLYMGRHQLPYFMLFTSTLYQEAFHAVQMKGREIKVEENAAIEHEAHVAQLKFNAKLREFVKKVPESQRRFRLELDVIDRNLRESIKAYELGLIERTGISIPK